MSFSNLNLQESFVTSIEEAGYLAPTELQTQLIPLVGDRKSVLVWSQSAAGKTGAFLIPAVNYILANPLEEKRGARILILTSRRDRVSQINYTLKRLTSNHNMRFGFIVSGRPYQPQMRLMRRPLDMMVATPGRLNDLVDNNKADFSQLEMLIIDDMTTIYQKNMHGLIAKILDQVKSDCPTIAFVRHNDEVTRLARELFPDAVEIEGIVEEEEVLPDHLESGRSIIHTPVQSRNDFPSHKQHAYVADDYTHKIALMDHFLDEFAGQPTVIYTSTNKAAITLQENMANHGHVAGLAHQLKTQDISPTDTPTLIVSDQQAVNLPEGTDQNIIHFDLPYKTENYRKRLESHSEARESAMIIIADGNDYDALRRIEKAIGSPVTQRTAPGLEPLNPFISTQKHTLRKPNGAKTRAKSGPSKDNQKRTNKGRTTLSRQQAEKGTASENKRGRTTNTNARKNGRTNNSTSSGNKDQRRQRKGPYGRLNGGVQRKRTEFGVSTVGTQSNQPARMPDKDWDNAIAENKSGKEKRVVIRYKDRKRTLLREDPNADS